MHGSRSAIEPTRTRIALRVRGVVQGVGFRPFVATLARSLELGGFVRNHVGGVVVEVEGEEDDVERFVDELKKRPPKLARIDHVDRTTKVARGERSFRIETSAIDVESGEGPVITPDAGICDDCLREIGDPSDRRFGHAFASCTACGPRLTIVESAPYDRARTTMASFPMCEACRGEYDDASDRRFHAQPIACPACGPRVVLVDPRGNELDAADAIGHAARVLTGGGIVAVKGIGGYHLACDATNDEAVRTLRTRKRRDAKPFAVMVADVEAASDIARMSEEEKALLTSPARPIVLLARADASGASRAIAPGVAPAMGRIGIVLAYTPLHHLLLRAVGRPLVMTSGNVTDEPIAFTDADARVRLGPIADALLVHDRPVRTRCDDSIARVANGVSSVLRRARGYTPSTVRLPHVLARPTLALGGHLKSAFALGRGDEAIPSHHLGDLEHPEALRAYRDALAHLEQLLALRPERVVHDLHRDYATTILAEELGKRGVERVAVQHHEAHASAVLAEHGVTGPAVAVVFDGAGLGRDGTIWGGEIFTGKLGALRRAASLRGGALPGGDRAAREPWRMAIAHALAAGLPMDRVASLLGVAPVLAVRIASVAASSITPRTSSVGRLFDAVAALAGVRNENAFEAQAAMELEAEATAAGLGPILPFDLHVRDHGLQIDPRPLFRALLELRISSAAPRGELAWGFHAGLARVVGEACERLAEQTETRLVALSGGVFANALLSTLLERDLTARGLRVLVHREIPMNDGGLAYGQLAAVAAGDQS